LRGDVRLRRPGILHRGVHRLHHQEPEIGIWKRGRRLRKERGAQSELGGERELEKGPDRRGGGPADLHGALGCGVGEPAGAVVLDVCQGAVEIRRGEPVFGAEPLAARQVIVVKHLDRLGPFPHPSS